MNTASGDFSFDLEEDTRRPGEDLTEVFSVPGLPALPALKPRWGQSARILRPLWSSQPEPGIVEALRAACDSYAPPAMAEARGSRRSRRSRRRAQG